MRFTIASVLSIATVASAAAVAPRADYGYWEFTGSFNYQVNQHTATNIEATYHNSELSEPITVTCSSRYTPAPESKLEASCSDESFSYEFNEDNLVDNTSSVTFSQTVGLWGEQVTVQGTKDVKWDFSNGSGSSAVATDKIEASSGVA